MNNRAAWGLETAVQAIERGDWAVLRGITVTQPETAATYHFVKHNVRIRGCTLLHAAALLGSQDACTLIIQEAASLLNRLTDDVGSSPLAVAAYMGHVSTVALLLKLGADVRYKRFDGQSAMEMAAQKRHNDVVMLLLKAESDLEAGPPEYEQQGRDLLQYATQTARELKTFPPADIPTYSPMEQVGGSPIKAGVVTKKGRGINKFGNLIKRGGRRSKKKRYLCLFADRVTWADSIEAQPKNTIELVKEATIVRVDTKPNRLMLTTPARPIEFDASTIEECGQWLEAVTAAIEALRLVVML